MHRSSETAWHCYLVKLMVCNQTSTNSCWWTFWKVETGEKSENLAFRVFKHGTLLEGSAHTSPKGSSSVESMPVHAKLQWCPAQGSFHSEIQARLSLRCTAQECVHLPIVESHGSGQGQPDASLGFWLNWGQNNNELEWTTTQLPNKEGKKARVA